jgi:hypothetical protein
MYIYQISSKLLIRFCDFHIIQCIQGISKIKEGYNPATWMLEVTTATQEKNLGVDFSDIYKKSELYQ